MSETRVRFPVAGPSGSITLEGILTVPDGNAMRPGVVVAHPHPLRGGDMYNNVVSALCDGIALAGVASLRFNFRGVGGSEGVHDNGTAEVDDVRAALDYLGQQTGVDGDNIGLAGYSFGARTSLQVAPTVALAALLCVAPPMRTPLPESDTHCPTLVLVGDRDQVTEGDANAYGAKLSEGAELRVIAGTDHFWQGFEPMLVSAAREFFSTAFALDKAPS